MGDIRSGLRRGISATGQGAVGAWLLLFYLFSFWMVLGTLSSQKFQEQIRLERTGAEAAASGVAEVLAYRERLSAIAARMRNGESVDAGDFPDPVPLERIRSGPVSVAVVRELLSIQRELEDANAALTEGEDRGWRIREQRTAVNYSLVAAGEREETLETRLKSRIGAAGGSAESDGRVDPPAPTPEMREEHPELAELYDSWETAAAEWKRLDDEYGQLTRMLETVKTRNLENRRRREELQSRQEALLSRHPKLKDYLNDAVFLRMMGLHFLATMPGQMLTLILTLCMGGLGSVIYLTRYFFDGPESRSLGWYVFRTLLGMGTAVAVFILAKAGQLIISDSAVSGSVDGNLNPFFISFLAIVSGLMSEQAYTRIERSGIAFFRVGDGESRERWAFGVRRAMADREGKTAEELARRLEIPPETAAGWLAERRPVPADAQRAIALWLGRDDRELFSDRPPPDAKNEPPPEGEGASNPKNDG